MSYPESARVFVGGVTEHTTQEDLTSQFDKFGPIAKVWVARNPPGFAFVDFEAAADASEAVEQMNEVNGWRVEKARPRRPGGGRGGGRGGYNDRDRGFGGDRRGGYDNYGDRDRGGGYGDRGYGDRRGGYGGGGGGGYGDRGGGYGDRGGGYGDRGGGYGGRYEDRGRDRYGDDRYGSRYDDRRASPPARGSPGA